MAVMAVVPFATVLADLSNPLSGFGFAGAGVALSVILSIVVGIPAYILLTSFPMWLAAKMAVPTETTYGSAVKVVTGHFLAALLIYAIAFLMLFLGGTLGGPRGVMIIFGISNLMLILATLSITGNGYGIDILHAFGVQLLSGLMMVVFGALIFLGFSLVLGMAGAMAPIQASIQKLHGVQNTSGFSVTPPPSESELDPTSAPAPPPPDYTAEIDNLLNTTLHPTGSAPTLAEREDIVRILQQKLQSQRGNLQPGDSRSAIVYQNQLNRYLLLLDQVKMERKLHPPNSTAANPEAVR